MKTLEEKKLLVKMARMLGEPVDPLLVESIEKEEKLSKIMFGEEAQPLVEETITEEPMLLKEADPPPIPNAGLLLQKLSQVKSLPTILTMPPAPVEVPAPVPSNAVTPKVPPMIERLQKDELEALKKTINQVVGKINTLSWGGGGTGIVRVWDADDFIRTSATDSKQFMTFRNGYFQMDYINPKEIVANTAYVTSNTYQITNNDYYIGVNVASTVVITLPPSSEIFTGREFYVKDESGNAGAPARFIDIYPSGSDKIDGQNYVRLQIDYGGLKFIYRNGWRVI